MQSAAPPLEVPASGLLRPDGPAGTSALAATMEIAAALATSRCVRRNMVPPYGQSEPSCSPDGLSSAQNIQYGEDLFGPLIVSDEGITTALAPGDI